MKADNIIPFVREVSEFREAREPVRVEPGVGYEIRGAYVVTWLDANGQMIGSVVVRSGQPMVAPLDAAFLSLAA